MLGVGAGQYFVIFVGHYLIFSVFPFPVVLPILLAMLPALIGEAGALGELIGKAWHIRSTNN